MAHRITVALPHGDAEKLQEMGRKMHGDYSLGINQAVHVLLEALVSGTHYMAKKRQPKAKPKDED